MLPGLTCVALATLVAAPILGAEAPPQGPRREDPASWRWNIPDGPAIPCIQHHVLKSKLLGFEVGYNVYLPPAYTEAAGKEKRFPVIYFLHGAGGNENSDAGGFSKIVAKAIQAGTVPPSICVFPNGALSGYRDRPERKLMVESMIVQELIPAVDAAFRTIRSAEGRTACGFSMGGGGALFLAARHPGLFRAAGSWGGRTGSQAAADLHEALRTNAEALKKNRVRFLVVIGETDTREANEQLIPVLKELGLAHEYRMLPGVGHELGRYYSETGDAMVRFLAAGAKAGGE